MKKILYLIPVLFLSSCFFTVGDLPPDFCDISQSKVVKDDGAAVRCGDATISYNFNNQNQRYELQLRTLRMVPDDNGSQQDVDLTLNLSDVNPLTSADFLNDATGTKAWNFRFQWYDFIVGNIQPSVVALKIDSDSTVSASVVFTASLSQIDNNGGGEFSYTFRNIKLPALPNN